MRTKRRVQGGALRATALGAMTISACGGMVEDTSSDSGADSPASHIEGGAGTGVRIRDAGIPFLDVGILGPPLFTDSGEGFHVCMGGGDGVDNCGVNKDEDCCAVVQLAGGTWNRRGDPNFPATIKPFKLSKYEVTVGRFKKFVQAGEGVQSAASHYAAHYGAVPGDTVGGWDPSFAVNLSTDLAADMAGGSWDYPDKTYAMYGPNFYDALLFCAWDGGFLPTEAMWLFAAEGGNENRIYPWARNPPTGFPPSPTTTSNAWFCPTGSGTSPSDWACNIAGQDVARVWDIPGSASKDGIFNLTGNVAEVWQDYAGKVATGTAPDGGIAYAYPDMPMPCDANAPGAVNGCPRSNPNFQGTQLTRRAVTPGAWGLPDNFVEADGTALYPPGTGLLTTRSTHQSLRPDFESIYFGFRCAYP
jgi:formylglycine-generating enzyme required for sulfatase activity